MRIGHRTGSRLARERPEALGRQRGGRCIKRALLVFLVLASLLCASAKKRKSKPPDIAVIQVVARRSDGRIGFDGQVRNTGEKPIPSLTLIFKVMAPEKEVVTTQRGVVDDELLEPGDDCEFHWMMQDHARAVTFLIEAMDGKERDLVVDKAGPYPIE